jgi:hypothetical protein
MCMNKTTSARGLSRVVAITFSLLIAAGLLLTPTHLSVAYAVSRITFAARVDYGVGDKPRSVAVGDFDGDGNPDLATANWLYDDVSVLLNNGDGTFAAPVDYAAGDRPWCVAVGDFDGDGKPDLAVGKWSDDDVSVLLNNGDGTFAAKVGYGVGS